MKMKVCFHPVTVPLALLAVCILSYGLLLPNLGFYGDDWEFILILRLLNPGDFWRYFEGARPLAAWPFVLVGPFLGTQPIHWQIFGVALRWTTVLAGWWAFSSLWPRHLRQVTMAMLVFAVYPVFIQQPYSVPYVAHWLGYTFYFISLGAMAQSLRHRPFYWHWTALSMLALGINLSLNEYYVGVALLYPFAAWMLGEGVPWRKRLGNSVRYSIPLLLVLTVFVLWRIGLSIQNPELADRPHLLFNILNQPLTTIPHFLQLILQDTLYILVTSWYQTLQPALIDLTRSFSVFSWGVVLAAMSGCIIYLSNLQAPAADADYLVSTSWAKQAFGLGILATLLGCLPIWSTDRHVVGGVFSDRSGMAAMFGASLVIVALLEWLSQRWMPKIILVSLLVGLGSGLHTRVANDYRWSWTTQKRLHWQLFWRAPSIQPATTILADSDMFAFSRPIFSFNLLYLQPQQQSKRLAYWFNILGKEVPADLANYPGGIDFKQDFRGFTYAANSQNSLVVFYSPPASECLWVLRPEDVEHHPYLPSAAREAALVSNLSRIQPQPRQDGYPPVEIFGPEPEHTWCYFYEKAELARQMADWKQVVELGAEVRDNGYSPMQTDSPFEWLPFIEGYARSGKWDVAKEWTLASLQRDQRYRAMLCGLWQRIDKNTPALTPADRVTFTDITQSLQCGK